MPGRTTARGYGTNHQRARNAALAALTDGDLCWRCRRPMYRAQAATLDLGHDDRVPGKQAYRGLEHRACNRSAGATKGNRQRGRQRRAARQQSKAPAPTLNPSRQW